MYKDGVDQVSYVTVILSSGYIIIYKFIKSNDI